MIFCNLQQQIIGIGPVWFLSFWILTTQRYMFYLSQNTGKPTLENVVGTKICSQGKPEIFHCHLHNVHLYD